MDDTVSGKEFLSASDDSLESSDEPKCLLNTAVLFLVFNRPETTECVFETIREARPPRLYVAADGPRDNRIVEIEKVMLVREIVTQVDWPCELKTLFRDDNLGCKAAIGQAITWFFDHEEQGIILEDDCLASSGFYVFCEEMLDRYKGNEKVRMITGDNFQQGHWRGDSSYYFSKYSHIWGWASWRDSWRNFDAAMSYWPEWKKSKHWEQSFKIAEERRYWNRMFSRSYRSEVDTWDYAWMASIWRSSGLTVIPNKNLVTNIGFGPDATHTRNPNSKMIVQTEELGSITHPDEMRACDEADAFFFEHFLQESIGQLVLRSPGIVWKYIVAWIK